LYDQPSQTGFNQRQARPPHRQRYLSVNASGIWGAFVASMDFASPAGSPVVNQAEQKMKILQAVHFVWYPASK
jgi:hypothetical protein